MLKNVLVLFALSLSIASSNAQAAMPTANFTYSINGLVVMFTDISNYGSCTPAPVWNFGDTASGANNTGVFSVGSHTFTAPGSYNVCLTAGTNGPCSTAPTQKCTTVTVGSTGIYEERGSSVLVSDFAVIKSEGIVIKYNLLSDAKVQLEVFNILGKSIYIAPLEQQVPSHYNVKLEMDSRISSGVYFARLIANGKANTIKFLIE